MTLVLEDDHVAQLLPMADCIDAMEIAFRDFANGGVNLPRIRYRSATSNPDVTYGSNIHIGTVPSLDVAAVRLGGSARSTAAPGRGAEARGPGERSWGFICLISMRTGELLAIIQELVLSGLRVGATSGLAVKHIARDDGSRGSATRYRPSGSGPTSRGGTSAVSPRLRDAGPGLREGWATRVQSGP